MTGIRSEQSVGDGRAHPAAADDAAHLFAAAAVVAALLFGLAALLGAIGYVVSVVRAR